MLFNFSPIDSEPYPMYMSQDEKEIAVEIEKLEKEIEYATYA